MVAIYIIKKIRKGLTMKKIILSLILLAIIVMLVNFSYAATDNTLHFDISYTGEVTVNEEKSATIILAGENTQVYTNVIVKVDIDGPTKPKVLATDSLGNQIDIAQEGYWGPQAGFTIGGTFSNETPIKATFTQAGTYTITLSLLNVQNNNDILTSKVITIEVREDTPIVNEVVNQVTNEIVNQTPEELPKTGASLLDYVVCIFVLIMVIYLSNRIRKR